MSMTKRTRSNLGIFSKSLSLEIKPKSFEKIDNNCIRTREILFNQKTFYEILLDFIKKTQLKYLSLTKTEKNKRNEKPNYSKIKEIIINLKEDLSTILTEKQSTLNYNQKIYSKKKAELQNLIFPSKDCKTNQQLSDYEPIITESNEKYEKSEINQIKCMNFVIENEILNIDYFIDKKKRKIEYLKNFELVIEENKEIICNNNHDQKEVTNILHTSLIEMRGYFMEKVFEKNKNDYIIDDLESRIKSFSENDDDKNKIYNSLDIIPEESKDYTESTICNNNLLLINSRKPSLKYSSNDSIFKLALCNESPTNITDLKKYLKLNMNINVNINVNNVNNQYFENAFKLCEINKDEKETNDDKTEKKLGFYLIDYNPNNLNLNKEDKNHMENGEKIILKQDNERTASSISSDC